MTQIIQLTQGYETVVDDDDYKELVSFNWHVLNGHPRISYAARWLPKSHPRVVIRMHHQILRIHPARLRRDNLVVDHIDRDGLNNQKANLRVTTKSQNMINSRHCDNAKGIYYDKSRNRWKAFILLPQKQYIGTFETYEQAFTARTEWMHREDN